MSELTVVGGVYSESCAKPHWNEIYGSGGRAAVAAGALVDRLSLHAYASAETASLVRAMWGAYGVTLVGHESAALIAFDYLHPMARPYIWPSSVPRLQTFEVEAETVLRFGMIEGGGVVRAERCVYDPQNPVSPEPFGANGSSASELAIVANLAEARLLSGAEEPAQALAALLKSHDASVVVVKMGAHGCLVGGRDGVQTHLPAWRTTSVWPIGSGDVFAAIFTVYWAVRHESPIRAAEIASRAVAYYVESRSLPIPAPSVLPDLAAIEAFQLGPVYLAGPFFSLEQRWLVEEFRALIAGQGIEVISPLHDIGEGPTELVVPADLAALRRSTAVLALLDGEDSGTLFEVGFARALGKPVIGYAEHPDAEALKMVAGSGCQLFDDVASAIYSLVWS